MVRSRLGSKLLAAERSCCRIGVAIIVSSACEQAKATPDTQGVIPALAGDTQAGPFSSRLGGALLPLRASCCACCLLATPVDAALAAAWLRLRASGHGVRGIWRRAHGCRNAAPSCSCQWSGPTDPFRLGHYTPRDCRGDLRPVLWPYTTKWTTEICPRSLCSRSLGLPCRPSTTPQMPLPSPSRPAKTPEVRRLTW